MERLNDNFIKLINFPGMGALRVKCHLTSGWPMFKGRSKNQT